MSSDIIIFQSPEEVEKIVKEHRDIEYEKLLNDFGVQNTYHIDNILDMNDKSAADKSFWIQSNILSILAKQVITYCYPIIKEYPKAHVAINTEPDTKAKDFFIQLQVNHEIHGFLLDENKIFHKIAIPSEIPFRVIGLRVPSILLPHIDYTSQMSVNPLTSNFPDVYHSGAYGNELVVKTRSNISPFTQQMMDIIRTKKISHDDVMLNNADVAKEELEKLLVRIRVFRDNYVKFLPFFIITQPNKKIKSDVYVSVDKTSAELPKELADLFYYPFINKNGFREKLVSEGLWVLYNNIQKLGMSNEDIVHEINQKKMTNKIKKSLSEQSKEVALLIVDDFRKQAIINKKFPGKNIKELKQKERDVVQKEFEQQLKRAEILKDAKIKESVHEFLKSFDNLNTEITLNSSYNAIKSILNNQINLADIGLCEHHMKHAELLLAGYKSGDIYKARSSFDIREALIKEFTNTDTQIDKEYFCKICGVLIARDSDSEVVEFIGDVRVDSGYETDALNELVYRDVSHIMRTFVKFKVLPPDLRPIIKSLVNTLTPEMHVIETKLKQIQTNISDDMRDLMGMYVYIYTFALVSHMIYVNYGQITFAFREGALGGGLTKQELDKLPLHKMSIHDDNEQQKIIKEIDDKLRSGHESLIEEEEDLIKEEEDLIKETEIEKDIETKVGGEGAGEENAKERLQNILKNALYLINTTKIKMLKASSNIGPDKVKPILLQAYQWVLKLQTYKEIATSDSDINFDMLNAIIGSSIYGYLWTVKSIQQHKTRLEDITSVIGTNLDKIKENNYKKTDKINPFKSAQLLTEKEWKKSGYKYYDDYTYGSYLQSAQYEKEEKYRSFITPLGEPLLKYYDGAKTLIDIEKRLRYQSRFIENNRCFNNVPKTFEYISVQQIKLNIGKYYRPDGSKRKWEIMVFEPKNGKGESKELSFSEFKSMEYEERLKYRIVDRKDGNDYLSEVKDYSNVVEAKFSQADFSKGLLEYFENRCPADGIHEFENSDICTKCNRDMEASWIHTPKAEDYIKKYTAVFNKNIQIKAQLVRFNLAKLIKAIETHEHKFEKFDDWVYSEVQLLEWSRLVPKINLNMILNLGCTEHKKYNLIEKEHESPVKLYENADHLGRINKLDSYYHSIIRDYYSIKNYHLFDFPPPYYKDLINKFKNELNKLPDLKDKNYHKKIEWYKIQHTNQAHLLCNFILVQTADVLLELSKTSPAGKAFAELLSANIISKDKMFSKPDPFKFIIDKRTKDDEYASDSSSEGSDLTDATEIESVVDFEASSDTNEQTQETEAYSFGLEETGIDDVNDGNDDEENTAAAE